MARKKSDRDTILVILHAIQGKKTVTVNRQRFEYDGSDNHAATDKRLMKLIEGLEAPIEITVRRWLADSYLDAKNKVHYWSVIYGLLLTDKRIDCIQANVMQRRRKKMEACCFEELNLHNVLASLFTGAAGGDIGVAGGSAYKAAIDQGGDCGDACEAAIQAAAEAAIKSIRGEDQGEDRD